MASSVVLLGVCVLLGGLGRLHDRVLPRGVPDDKESVRSTIVDIKPDGRAYMEEFDEEADTYTESEGTKDPAMLQENYEPMPAFGDWASVTRINRDKPVDQQPPESGSWLVLKNPV